MLALISADPRLELDGFDPRGLLIPHNPLLHQLSVHDTGDGDDWIEELLALPEEKESNGTESAPESTDSMGKPRFPNLRYLSLQRCQLLAFPNLPLTSLSHLDLSHNELNSIPDLSTLHNLVSLNLSNNVITSVRNAPSSLGNVATINLSNNRIDCLVGLDRLLGLKRVDVRSNHLPEAGEVGRLAVLPEIKSVWAASNPFSTTEWRPDVAATFVNEGREVVLDDTPLTWTEAREVDAILARRGHSRRSGEETRKSLEAERPVGPAGMAGGIVAPSPARVKSPRPPTSPVPSAPRSPAPKSVPTPAKSPEPTRTTKVSQKRRTRRRVNLDGGDPADT